MDNRTAIGLVARREITTRLRSRAFLITTALLLVGVVASSLIVHLVSGSSSATKIGVTASTATLAEPLRVTGAAVGRQVTVTQVDQTAGEDEVRAGKLDVLLTGDLAQPTAVVHKRISDTDRNLLAVV